MDALERTLEQKVRARAWPDPQVGGGWACTAALPECIGAPGKSRLCPTLRLASFLLF